MSLRISPYLVSENSKEDSTVKTQRTDLQSAAAKLALIAALNADQTVLEFMPKFKFRLLHGLTMFNILEALIVVWILFEVTDGLAIGIIVAMWIGVILFSCALAAVALKNRNHAGAVVQVLALLAFALNLGIDVCVVNMESFGRFPIAVVASIALLLTLPTVTNYSIPFLAGGWAIAAIHLIIICAVVSSYDIIGQLLLIVGCIVLGAIVLYGVYQQRKLALKFVAGSEQVQQGFTVLSSEPEPVSGTVISGIEILVKNIIEIEKILTRESTNQDPKRAHQLGKALDLIHSTKVEIREENIYNVLIDTVNPQMDPEDWKFLLENFIETKKAYGSQKQSQRQSPSIIVQQPTLPPMNAQSSSELLSDIDYDEIQKALNQLGKNWNFDMFFISECSKHPVIICGKFMIKKHKLDQLFQISETAMEQFLEAVETRYLPNPYHNCTHAADVMNSIFFLVKNSVINNHVTNLEILAVIVSSLCHDVGHFAQTNRFLVATRHKIAIKFNDASVLESMHCAITFKLLQQDQYNILSNLDGDDWSAIRRIIIEMILATDMAKHFELLGQFRAKLNSGADHDLTNSDERMFMLKFLLKCSDIGHAAKSVDLHEQWSLKVCEEFFNQGDIEQQRNMPVSMYCDRATTDIAKSQSGFIQNLVIPLFECVNGFLKSSEISKTCIRQLHMNVRHWENYGKSKRKTQYNKDLEYDDKETLFEQLQSKMMKRKRQNSLDKTHDQLLSKSAEHEHDSFND